ncbi:MAG TPA: lytic transglycosylase domain-containing protein [Elusimicrobiota bacterium]|nr:lytic transglycosylase domain-containing protein [Elusimicrobiota bacterium]
MKVFAFISVLLLAAAPQLNAAKAVVGRQYLLNQIDNWEYFFARNPKNAKKAGDSVPQLRELLGEAEQARGGEVAPLASRFEAWQSAVLVKLSDKDHASNMAGFEHYMKYLVASARQMAQREKEEKQRRELAEKAETAELNAAQAPEQAFDGGGVAMAAAVPPVAQTSAREPSRMASLDVSAPEVQPMAVALGAVPDPVVEAAPAAAAQPYTCASLGNLCPQLLKAGATIKIIQDVLTEAKKSGANPILIFAVMESESSFYAKARSQAGALGLMQIMPDTGKQLGVRSAKKLFDIKTNIRLGIRYLKSLWNDFCDFSMSELNSINPWMRADVKKAIAAYNAGPAAVLKYGAVPPYRETRHYVAKVLRNFYNLRRASQSQD